MYKYLLTTTPWLESIAKKEITKLWYKIIEVQDRMIKFSWDINAMAKVNLWSRVWNKLYMILEEKNNVDSFDSLYDLVFSIKRKDYIKKESPTVIKAKSIKSDLSSTPTIQKISKKAIVDKLAWKWWKLRENEDTKKTDVFVFIMNNKAYILLNTSGEALHKRWYRKKTSEAPIKESLAAWLVLLSWWKFKDNFYDIFCGSWTIAIEAILIAKNIAPWLNRSFAFNHFPITPDWLLENEKKLARHKIFEWDYKIFASDIDEEILEIAKENAKNTWVADYINFSKKDFREYIWVNLNWTLVSNPPYWLRLKPDDLENLYKDINTILMNSKDLNWWIISSYEKFSWKNYKNRKLYNWWELAYFYRKI